MEELPWYAKTLLLKATGGDPQGFLKALQGGSGEGGTLRNRPAWAETALVQPTHPSISNGKKKVLRETK